MRLKTQEDKKMGYQTVNSDVVLVGAGANQDIQPPATQDWEVTAIGSSVWVGVQPFQVPQVTVSLFDGTNIAQIMRSTDVRGWYRRQKLHINNTNYLRLNNPGGAGANISWSARLTRFFGAGSSNVISDLQVLGAAATFDVRPVAGIDWLITDVGSANWLGAAPAGVPNIDLDLTDGTFTAQILDPASGRLWEAELELFSSRLNYLNIANVAAVQAVVCFVGVIYRSYGGSGDSVVINDLLNAGAAASVDFRPAAGYEWRITAVAAATWVGVPPLLFPDITVHIFDGTLASMVQSQINWMQQGHAMEIIIDNTNYLRITNTNAAGQNVGMVGERVQRYAS
jgi:hypothetical protein